MTNLETLRPTTKLLCKEFIRLCELEGIPVVIHETDRLSDKQKAYYAQGRESLEEVNRLRERVKLYPLTEEENKRKVTKAPPGSSPHEYGLAWDFVLLINGQKSWNDKDPRWKRAVEIAESLNINGFTLECGYRWKTFPDAPHIQICKIDPIIKVKTSWKAFK